jgi:phage gp45-like
MLSDDLRRHAGKYYGKFSGEVTNNEDDTQVGRILVKVPSVFGPDIEVSARPCLPYGHFFVPPVGARVWVEFEAGDTNHPIWVGVWYPSGAAPEPARISPPDNRVIQTASGHTIEIKDVEGEERILIRHKDNAFVSMDEKGSVLVSNKNGSHIHLDADAGNASFVEQHGNSVTMTDQGMALVNKDGTTVNITGATVHVIATNAVIEATTTALGKGAAEPTLMGNAFQMLWTAVQTHVHPSAMGPTSPSPTLAPLMLQPGVHLTSSVLVK